MPGLGYKGKLGRHHRRTGGNAFLCGMEGLSLQQRLARDLPGNPCAMTAASLGRARLYFSGGETSRYMVQDKYDRMT